MNAAKRLQQMARVDASVMLPHADPVTDTIKNTKPMAGAACAPTASLLTR